MNKHTSFLKKKKKTSKCDEIASYGEVEHLNAFILLHPHFHTAEVNMNFTTHWQDVFLLWSVIHVTLSHRQVTK